MSLYSEIRDNNKKKSNSLTKALIKNQKALNIISMSLFLTMLIADIIYLIKENIIGITPYTNIFMIIAIIAEALIFLAMILLRFNNENIIIKSIPLVIYSLPIIAYLPMLGYGDVFTIFLFIFRFLLSICLLMVLLKENRLKDRKGYRFRQIIYISLALCIFITAFVLLISNQSRRVLYSYDEDLSGYIVKDVMKGSSDVEFKDDTKKIDDNSLKYAGSSLNIPASVKEISSNAFNDSDIEEIHLYSTNIKIVEALNNSNVKYIYLEEDNINIADISKANSKSMFKFVSSKELVDKYRSTYRGCDYLFIPKCDEGEYYVLYNSTDLPVEYRHLNELVEKPNVNNFNNDKVRLTNWIYTYKDSYGRINSPKFPITVSDNVELTAYWSKVYTISFNYNGGIIDTLGSTEFENMPNTINICVEDEDLILPTLTKNGYRFDGWYIDDELIEDYIIHATIASDMLVEAKYSRIFKLKYHENGGYIPDDEKNQEYIDGDTITPATPERLGYEFEGWYDNPTFAGSRMELVTNYNIELYAKWKLVAPIITVSDINKVYDNNPEALSLIIRHPLIGDEDFSISYKWYKNDETKVISTKSTYNVIEAQNNKYYCHVTIKHLGNTYEIDSNYINVNIEKADYDLSNIVFDNQTFTYEFNGNQQHPQITNIPKGKDGISVFVQYSYNGNFTNVGDTGTVTATFTTDSTNYNVPSSMTANVEIIQRVLQAEFDSVEFVYDGNPHRPLATLIGVVDGYPVELTYPSILTSDVGDYTLLVNITDNTNYYLELTEVSYKIIEADYDLSNLTFDKTQFDYDGNSHLPTPNNLPAGLSLDISNSIGALNVNDTKATLKFINTNPNYNNPTELLVNVTINPRQVGVTLDKTEFVYNGNVQTPIPTLVGIINGDNCTCNVLNNSINFGTYTFEFELVGSDKNNYQISNDSLNKTYVIKKADYDLSNLTFDKTQFDYDGNSHLPNITNLPNGLSLDVNNSIGALSVKDTQVTLKFINSSTNYNNPSDLLVNVTINPKKVIVNLSNSELTYQKKLLLPNVELVGIIDNDNVDYNILTTDSINAGNYTLNIGLVGSDSNNYVIDLDNSNLNYVIQKADFDIQYIFLENTEYVYDGELHHPSLDLVNGKKKYYTLYQDEIVISYIDEYKNAGDYNAKIEFSIPSNSENYVSAKINTYKLTITKKEVTLEFDSLLFEYSEGILHTPIVNSIIGKIAGDDLVITVTNNNITEVGEYELNLSYSGAQVGNYNVIETYTAVVVSGTRDITGFTVNNYEGIYDGNEHTVTVSGLEEGVTAVFDKKVKDVCNNVEVKITFVSIDPNEGISTTALGYITINPKPITVEFDTTTKLIYNGEKQIPNATLTGVILGDSVNVVIANESTNAGIYNATATLDNSNYQISNSADLTYEIEKCHVTLVWGQLDLIYSRQVLKPTATVKYNNEVLNTDVIVTAANNINVGSYTAVASLEDDNYIIDGETSTTYNILAKGVSLEWSNKILTYNGEAQAPSAIVTPITGDNCTVIISGENTIPGSYQATASLNNSNYKIDGSNTTTYTITNSTLVESECNDIEYLTTVTYDGTKHGPSISNVNKYTNDGSLILYKYDGIKDAGSYYVDVTFYTENGYYDECKVTVALVISPMEVNISLNETELRFINSIVRPTFEATNLVLGDDVDISITNNSSAVGDYVAEFKITGSNKDNYKITNTYNYSIIKGIIDMTNVTFNNTNVIYSGNQQLPTSNNLPTGVSIDLDNSIGVINTSDTEATVKFILSSDTSKNYEIPNDINVSMTVSKKKLTINWLITEFGYDGTKHRPTYELDGILNNDVVELVFDTDGEINRGNYSITVSNVTNDNYYINSTSCNFEITRGTYDMSNVIIQDKTFTYDGKSHKSISVEQSELPDGVTVEYVYETDPVYAGKYKVIIEFEGDSNNYNAIPNMEAYVIINPATITISWSNTSFTYNGAYQSPSVSITSSLIGTDTCEISVSGAKKDAGTYTAQAILSNSNYTISDELATKEYTISPKSINVTVHNGSNTGTSFSYYYDGKIRNNMYVTYDDSNLIGSDDLDITVNTSNIKSVVGTYSYTLVFSNSNYTTNNITGTVTINKTTIYNVTWSQANNTVLPTATASINNETANISDMSEAIAYVYYQNSGNNQYTLMDGIPTTAGTYYVSCKPIDETCVSIPYYNQSWFAKQFTYAPVQVKEIWSNDGQYNSNIFTVSGNTSKNSASFEMDGENVTFTNGLKLESNIGSISFTINSTKKLTIYSTGGTTVKINDVSYNITSGSGTEITLDEGTYTIIKGNGSTIVYALVLE